MAYFWPSMPVRWFIAPLIWQCSATVAVAALKVAAVIVVAGFGRPVAVASAVQSAAVGAAAGAAMSSSPPPQAVTNRSSGTVRAARPRGAVSGLAILVIVCLRYRRAEH